MTDSRGAGARLGPGGEFDRIRSFLEGLPTGPSGVRVGPGDDACVLSDGIVLSADLSIEDVHFRLDWITAEEAGYRAVAGAVSDLAAMAAEPVGILASVAAPGTGEGASLIMSGVRRFAEAFGLLLLGGDLTRSPGPLLVDVVAVGRAEHPLLRSGAKEDDELWVTGGLGGAAAAAALWEAGQTPPAPLRRAFVEPAPRLAEARWLVEAGARAGIDISDGLAGDAGHVAAASELALVLEVETIPLHPALAAIPLPHGRTAEALALHGGEDYELLVAAPPGLLDSRVEEFTRRFDLSLSRVGRCTQGEGVFLDPGASGPLRRPTIGGYDHFATGGSS